MYFEAAREFPLPPVEIIPMRFDELVTIFGDYIECVFSWQRDVPKINKVRSSFFMSFF
jgi:hypothetical protein